jgi:hypothetical protein
LRSDPHFGGPWWKGRISEYREDKVRPKVRITLRITTCEDAEEVLNLGVE